MSDVEIRFEREGVSGIVAVGSNLADTARRFGIRFDDCQPVKSMHDCALIVSTGSDNLSPLTQRETEHFAANGRRSNERLACEAKIIKPGEIVIMTDQKKEQSKKNESTKAGFQAEFDALPLDKKFASLMRMEVATLSEAFSYIANSSLKMVEQVGDAITDFGTKIEYEAKKATSSNPKPPANAPKAAASSKAKPKAGTKRKPPARPAPEA